MSIRKIIAVTAISASIFLNACTTVLATEHNSYVDQVLKVFVGGGDHIEKLRSLHKETERYPEVVAALTDYTIFDHGTLLDLLFEEEGLAIIDALEKKVKTDVECLTKYIFICQPSLADRNHVILSTLRYYEEETRAD